MLFAMNVYLGKNICKVTGIIVDTFNGLKMSGTSHIQKDHLRPPSKDKVSFAKTAEVSGHCIEYMKFINNLL